MSCFFFFTVSLNSSLWFESDYRKTHNMSMCVCVFSTFGMLTQHGVCVVYGLYFFFSWIKISEQKRIASVKLFVVNLDMMFTCWQKSYLLYFRQGSLFFCALESRVVVADAWLVVFAVVIPLSSWFTCTFSFIFKCYFLHNCGIVVWKQLNMVNCCLYWND